MLSGVLTRRSHLNRTRLRSDSLQRHGRFLGRRFCFVFSFWAASCAVRRQTSGICSYSFRDACTGPSVARGGYCAFMVTSNDLSTAQFGSNGQHFKMLLDSGSTANYVDPSLTPGLQDSLSDVEFLQVSHTIVAARKNLLKGVATGVVTGTVIDDGGTER